MNKSTLIESIAEHQDVESKAAAKRIVDSLFSMLVSGIAAGEDVALSGVGTFYVVDREAREGRNPQNGETITIEAKRVPKFRASAKLKELVNA